MIEIGDATATTAKNSSLLSETRYAEKSMEGGRRRMMSPSIPTRAAGLRTYRPARFKDGEPRAWPPQLLAKTPNIIPALAKRMHHG